MLIGRQPDTLIGSNVKQVNKDYTCSFCTTSGVGSRRFPLHDVPIMEFLKPFQMPLVPISELNQSSLNGYKWI